MCQISSRTGRWSEPRLRNFHYALDRVLDPKPDQQHDYFTALIWVGSSRLLGATTDGQLIEFDFADRVQERLVTKLENEVLTIASNGETLLVALTSGSLQLRGHDGALIQEAKGASPVIAVAWCDAVKSWLIGREDGHLEVRNAHDMKVTHEVTLPGPVWSINSRTDDDHGATLIVGCEQPSVRLMRLSGAPLMLQTVDVLSVSSSHRRQVRSIRAVRFLRDGKQLLALDDLGRLSLWSLHNRQLEWLSPDHLPDPRRGSLQQLLKDRWSMLPFPLREDRAGILLLTIRDRVVTFGLTMVVNGSKMAFRKCVEVDEMRSVPTSTRHRDASTFAAACGQSSDRSEVSAGRSGDRQRSRSIESCRTNRRAHDRAPKRLGLFGSGHCSKPTSKTCCLHSTPVALDPMSVTFARRARIFFTQSG